MWRDRRQPPSGRSRPERNLRDQIFPFMGAIVRPDEDQRFRNDADRRLLWDDQQNARAAPAAEHATGGEDQRDSAANAARRRFEPEPMGRQNTERLGRAGVRQPPGRAVMSTLSRVVWLPYQPFADSAVAALIANTAGAERYPHAPGLPRPVRAIATGRRIMPG